MNYKIVFFTLLFLTELLHASDSRLLVHMLDYLSRDYSGAVDNQGKVLNVSEYQEQVDFSKEMVASADEIDEIRKSVKLRSDFKLLNQFVLKKAKPAEVQKLAEAIRFEVVLLLKIESSPSQWPEIKLGKTSYQKNCVSCHGSSGQGDGERALSLDPKPSNLIEAKFNTISPFQVFNTIRFGVQGTSMAAFEFSENEIWNLAFYVISLRYDEKNNLFLGKPKWSLQQASSQSDDELVKNLSVDTIEKNRLLTELRLYSGEGEADRFLIFAKNSIFRAKSEYDKKRYSAAKEAAVSAYLEGVEPIEIKLRSIDKLLCENIEEKFSELRNRIDTRAGNVEFEKTIQEIAELLDKAQEKLQEGPKSFWLTFSISLGVVLREAFEAILILITLLGVIRSMGLKRAAYYIHGGWISAVLSGVLLWILSGYLISISGATREMLEGTISLMAVSVLLYFGFWLHRRVEIGRWKSFINEMVKTALERKKLLGLSVVAFMGVFREAFETVLFLRAISLEAGANQGLPLLLGVIFALILALFLGWVLLNISSKLPIRQLFSVSSSIMFFLCFILIGKGIHSFQETGWLSSTRLPIVFRFDLLGVYPTYESIIPQLVLLVGTFLLWSLSFNQRSIES